MIAAKLLQSKSANGFIGINITGGVDLMGFLYAFLILIVISIIESKWENTYNKFADIFLIAVLWISVALVFLAYI